VIRCGAGRTEGVDESGGAGSECVALVTVRGEKRELMILRPVEKSPQSDLLEICVDETKLL
jgi:hypothetical protein